MAEKAYLAVDIGASSGRHVLGLFDGEQLRLEEVYRFENGRRRGRPADLHWDLLGQWSHVRQGLRAAAAKCGDRVTSVGVDTWGVDFGLLGRGDELLGNPYHYRDSRTNDTMAKAFGIVSREEIFRHTGLQFMQFNTLFQLLAMKLSGSPLLDIAESLLMMPDLFHWLLTGVKSNEMTNASTTPVLRSGQRRLGDGSAGEVLAAVADSRPDHAAGHDAGAAADERGGRVRACRRPRWCCPARTIRPAR